MRCWGGEEIPTEVINFRIYHAESPTQFLVILKCLCDSTVKCEGLEWHTSNLLESTWRCLTAYAAQLQRRPPQGCCLTHWCTLHNYSGFSLEKWVTLKSFTRSWHIPFHRALSDKILYTPIFYFIFADSTELKCEIHIATRNCTGVSDARVQCPTQLESADLRHRTRSGVTLGRRRLCTGLDSDGAIQQDSNRS